MRSGFWRWLRTLILAPFVAAALVKPRDWFMSDPEFVRRINATAITAVVLGIVLANTYLVAAGRTYRDLPPASWPWVIWFILLWLLLFLYFTETRITALLRDTRKLSRLAIGTSLLIGGASWGYLFLGVP